MDFRQWVQISSLRDDMVGEFCRDLISNFDFDGTQRYVELSIKKYSDLFVANRLILDHEHFNYESKLMDFRQWVKISRLRDDRVGEYCRYLISIFDSDGMRQYAKFVTKDYSNIFAALRLISEYRYYNYESKLMDFRQWVKISRLRDDMVGDYYIHGALCLIPDILLGVTTSILDVLFHL